MSVNRRWPKQKQPLEFGYRVLTTAHEMRPPTRDRQARYTLYRVDPVAKHPTNSIMKPRPAIDAPIATNIICTASIQNKRK